MNIKSIITLAAVVLLSAATVNAQEKTGRTAPVRVGVALTAGANSYLNVSALPGMQTSYGTQALSVGWTDKTLAFGVEGSLIFCDSWKLDLGGSFSYYNNPAYEGLKGTMGDTYEMGEIPSYEAVDAKFNMNWLAHLAWSYYFRIAAVPKLRPYVGLRVQGGYASDLSKSSFYQAMGVSAAESYTLAAGVLTGVDYYLGNNFFVGACVEPFRYTYGVVAYRPQEGLSTLAADTHFMGAFAAPQLKIGFVF
jgi:outer membrane protein W